MQGMQKAKCSSCGVMFMSESESKLCPSCAESGHGYGTDSCRCGHHN